MNTWQNQLHYDPLSPLGSSTNEALVYFVKRDLLREAVAPIRYVWHLPEAEKICKKQQVNGSWKYPGKNPVVYPQHHYPLVETWKQFRFLVEKYEFNDYYSKSF